MATNSNSAHFNNNINRIPKLPKSPTTTMPTFVWRSEKIELLEDLVETSMESHIQLSEEDKKIFQSRKRGDALQTFRNITSLNRKTLGENLTVFPRKLVSATGLPPSESEINRFSGRTLETSETYNRSCRSAAHGAIHRCQKSLPT